MAFTMTSTIVFDEINFCEAAIEKIFLDEDREFSLCEILTKELELLNLTEEEEEQIRINCDLEDEYHTLAEYLRNKVSMMLNDNCDSEAETDEETDED